MTERDEKHKEGFFQKVKHFFSHEKKTDDEYDRSILNPESSKDVNISRPIPTGETLASNTYNKNFETSNTDVKSRNNQDIIESELDRPETSRMRPISNDDLPGEHYVIHIGDSKAKPTTGITGINEDNLKKGENYGHPVGDSKPLPTPKDLSSNKDYEKTHKKDKYKVGESKPKKNKSGSNLSEKDREYEKTHKKDKYKVGESKPKKNKSGSNLSEKDKRKDKNKLGESVPLSSGFGSNDTHVIKGTNENIVILPVKDENHIILKESKQSELGSDLNQMPTSSRTNDMNQKSPSNMEKMPLQSNINQLPPTQSSNMNQMPITSNMNEMNQNPIPITSGMNQMPIQSNMNQIPPMQSSNMMPPMQSNMNQMPPNLNQMPMQSNMNQMPPNLNQMPMQSNMNQMPMNEMNQNPIPIPSGMNQMPMQSNMNQMPITSSNVESSLGETLVVVEKGVGNESDIHIYLNDKNPQSQSQGINDTGKF